MIEHLNQLLNSTEPTGYQTIIISIITTIITSILIYNCKFIWKLLKKLYRKIVKIINDRIVKFKMYRRLKNNMETNSDIEYLKNIQKERELKDYEKKAIKRHYKNRCLKGNISRTEYEELRKRKERNEHLEDYEIELLNRANEKIKESSKQLKDTFAKIDFDMMNRLSSRYK